MLNPFQRITPQWRQSASARTTRGRHAATLGVERLELRSLLSASSLAAPEGGPSHFEDALYDHPAAVTAQSPHGQLARSETSFWGDSLGNGYHQQAAHAQQLVALGATGGEAFRRSASAAAPTHFVYIITFTWKSPLADGGPTSPDGFSEDFAGIVEQPKSSGGSRPLASKAQPDSQNNSTIPPASDFLGDVLGSVEPSESASAIAPFATAQLAETQTSTMRFSAELRAHDVVFQTLTNSTVARRQDIETWALASAEESGWARTDTEGEAESIAGEDNADSQLELSSLRTLRRVTDAQADELADLLDRLEQQAPRTWRRYAQGRASALAEGATADTAAKAIGNATQPDEAAQQATIDEPGGMIFIRANHGANGSDDVIDALDAALAIDDLDQFLSGKLTGSLPVITAVAAEISTHPHDAPVQTTEDSAGSSSRSESQPSTSSSILPMAVAGLGAMVIAARGGRWRDWLKMRRSTTSPATPK
jgi:hypothetical protein